MVNFVKKKFFKKKMQKKIFKIKISKPFLKMYKISNPKNAPIRLNKIQISSILIVKTDTSKKSSFDIIKYRFMAISRICHEGVFCIVSCPWIFNRRLNLFRYTPGSKILIHFSSRSLELKAKSTIQVETHY